MRLAVHSINVEQYQSHWLHTREATWRQSNCYVDLWIEILSSLKLNPVASFGFTLNIDFEGDQWTFFKVPLADLYTLYGIDVQELTIWHAVLEHIITQVQRDRLVLMEVDAFYLPDVADTSYRQEHEKTTIGIQMIDPEERLLGYFHNSGYYTLSGEDFDGIFQASLLPPYTEFAKFDRVVRRSEQELGTMALCLLDTYLQNRPQQNPFIAYSHNFEQHCTELADLDTFHKYAFASMRQFGASYEYVSIFLKWLTEEHGAGLGEAAEHFAAIAETAQVLLMKTARTVKTGKLLKAQPLLQTMQEHWDQGMTSLAVTCQQVRNF